MWCLLGTVFIYCAGQPRTVPTSGGRALLVMPGPLKRRPRVGARVLVQGQMGRSVHPLAAELTGAWQAEPRLRAAQLLRTLLVLGEDNSHQHVQLLVPAFLK